MKNYCLFLFFIFFIFLNIANKKVYSQCYDNYMVDFMNKAPLNMLVYLEHYNLKINDIRKTKFVIYPDAFYRFYIYNTCNEYDSLKLNVFIKRNQRLNIELIKDDILNSYYFEFDPEKKGKIKFLVNGIDCECLTIISFCYRNDYKFKIE